MIRRPPRSTLFPTRRSSDLRRKTQRIKCFEIFLQLAPGDFAFASFRAQLFFQYQEPHETALCRSSLDRKSTRLNSSHVSISYAVFCLKKKRIEKVLSFV